MYKKPTRKSEKEKRFYHIEKQEEEKCNKEKNERDTCAASYEKRRKHQRMNKVKKNVLTNQDFL